MSECLFSYAKVIGTAQEKERFVVVYVVMKVLSCEFGAFGDREMRNG